MNFKSKIIFILGLVLSFNLFSAEVKLLDIYKDSLQKGALGLVLTETGSITHVYTIDNGVRADYKAERLRGGVPILELYNFDIISVKGTGFSKETGGEIQVKYLTGLRYMIPQFSTKTYDISRTSGSWKIYDQSENALSRLTFVIKKDAKGKEAGILRIDNK